MPQAVLMRSNKEKARMKVKVMIISNGQSQHTSQPESQTVLAALSIDTSVWLTSKLCSKKAGSKPGSTASPKANWTRSARF